MDDAISLTEQLQQFSCHDRDIAESVLRRVLPELHRIAVRELRRERYIAPLSATELISEVWLQSLHTGRFQVRSRSHFYAIAALAMRQVLVNFARLRIAQKRGCGAMPDSTTGADLDRLSSTSNLEEIVQMGLLMEQLDKEHPDRARIVDLHFFAGFTFDEISEKLQLSERQVRLRWKRDGIG